MHHSLKELRSIEVLLLLEEESIRSDGNASYSLAVRCIRERDALVVGEVGCIVFSLAAGDLARHFGDDFELLVLI